MCLRVQDFIAGETVNRKSGEKRGLNFWDVEQEREICDQWLEAECLSQRNQQDTCDIWMFCHKIKFFGSCQDKCYTNDTPLIQRVFCKEEICK